MPKPQREVINGRLVRVDDSSPLRALEWQADELRCSLITELDPPALRQIAAAVVPPGDGVERGGHVRIGALLLILGGLVIAFLAATRSRF